MANHPNRSAATDQNGNRISPDVHRVAHKTTGEQGWARRVWFGHRPATDIRWHVYATQRDADRGSVSDTYDNCQGLLATSCANWRDV